MDTPETKAPATLPVSKATNAYELLNEVAALAIEEPKRIAMGWYLLRQGDEPGGIDLSGFKEYPQCGTVGCIAGWVCALRGVAPSSYVAIGDDATRILGIDRKQSQDLFLDPRLCEDVDQQSLGHAAAVVRHIRAFQANNETQLKAKAV